MFLLKTFVSIMPLVFSPYVEEGEKCYEDMSIDYSIHYDEPAIGWEMGEEIVFQSSSIPFVNPEGGYHSMEVEAGASFVELARAATKAGYRIRVNSSHRTNWEQALLKKELGELAADAGWSNHQKGIAVDIARTNVFIPEKRINPKYFSSRCQPKKIRKVAGYKCPTRLFWWLKKNGPRYGFYNTVRKETWHWVYLGVKPVARLVRK